MTAIEELDQWVQAQKRDHGLVDFRVYPGSKADTGDLTVEEVAAEVLRVVKGDVERVDLTNVPL